MIFPAQAETAENEATPAFRTHLNYLQAFNLLSLTIAASGRSALPHTDIIVRNRHKLTDSVADNFGLGVMTLKTAQPSAGRA